MTCNQCAHKAVCHKEHHATDMEPEHYYYSDLNNVEDKCEHFLLDLNLKKFPVEVLSDHVFEHVSDTKTPQGILCIVKQKE